ncbi:MAG: ABC transporter ATP-binding protein [Bacillota bacterium]|nr:ABC transporter ATP-binding protein [Bacillota bacterium]
MKRRKREIPSAAPGREAGQDELRRRSVSETIGRLTPYMRGYRAAAVLCPVVMLIEVVTDVTIPLLMREIVNRGILAGDQQLVVRYGLLMILSAIIGLVTGVASAFLGAYAGFGFGARIRDSLFTSIQRFSFRNLDRFSIPSLITRLTNDVNNLANTVMMLLRMGIRAPAMFVFALVMAIRIDAELAVVFAVAIPLLIVTVLMIMRRAHPRFVRMQSRVDRVNARVQENLAGIRVVKSFVRQDHEKERFAEANDDLRNSAFSAISLVIIMGPIMSLVVSGCIVAILWIGGLRIIDSTLLPGDLMSFVTYVGQILFSLMMLSMLFLNFTRGKTSSDRILEVIDTEVDILSPEAKPDFTPVARLGDASIRFEAVRFRYHGNARDALEDINLDIRPGETIGIIGSTGSGKTSLIQLIPRLYDVTEGRVLVGGVDVRDYDLAALRDGVAVVLQRNTLFSGTIRSNMLWGKSDATDAEIETALRQAQAWDFVVADPAGLDAAVEQEGTNYSGGQRQRLCIARALLKKPQVLILDDSTSAVDMATDARIRRVFKSELAGVTTLIIAQRIASIEHADRVLVLDDGRIDAFGSIAEVREQSAIFREIQESQQRGIAS